MIWITHPVLALYFTLTLTATMMAFVTPLAGAPLWVCAPTAILAAILFLIGFIEQRWCGMSKIADWISPRKPEEAIRQAIERGGEKKRK
jgi:hypothetical protein